MARYIFGGEITHLTVSADAGDNDALKVAAPGTAVELYDARTGGTLVDDFLLWDNTSSDYVTPATQIVANASGHLPDFQGPDGLEALYDADGNVLLPHAAAGTAGDLVHRTGDETIGGVKSFTTAPEVPDDSFDIGKVDGLSDALGGKLDADDLPSAFSSQAATYLPANDYKPIVVLDSGEPVTGLPDGTVVFRRVTAGGSTPTVNQIAVGGSTADGTTFNTDSMSPAAGALHLAHVTTADADGDAALASGSLTGAGLTWTRAADVSSTGTPNGVLHSALFVGAGTPTPGAVTIAPGATVESVSWRFIDVTNVETALVQAATAAPANGSTSPGVTLSGVDAANLVLGFIAQNNGNTITPGAGFTEIGAAQGSTTPSCFIAAQYKATGQNTVSWATTGTVQRTVIAIEVAPS